VTNIFNKAEAFRKLAETAAFKVWHRIEVAKRLGYIRALKR